MEQNLRRDYSILIGNCIDHFDTALYGFLAPILAPIFFPHSDPLVALIMTYSVFITSIVTRPLGAYIFGLIVRSHGAAISLSYSLIGVAITTVLIGLIPAYDTIGVLAPILLVIIHTLRGIFSSGEVTISRLYILENKTEEGALKSSYLYQTSTMLGIVLASFASTIIIICGTSQSWRICFLIGGITAFIGYFIRIYKTEKTSFSLRQLPVFYSVYGLISLWKNKIIVLHIAIIAAFSQITYSIPFIVMNNLIPIITDIKLTTMMSVNTILLVADMLMLPLVGKRLLKYKPKQIMLWTGVALIITIIPLWYFLANSSIIYVSLVRIWIVFLGVVFACPINLWYNNLIKGDEKYMIIGIGSSLGASTIGEMTPAICLFLYHLTNHYMIISLYIVIISASTLLVLMIRGKKNN